MLSTWRLGLKAAIMLLNPARIVIGGGIAKAGDRLFVPLRAELAQADHGVVARAHRRGPRRTGRRQRAVGRHGAGHAADRMKLPAFYPIIDTAFRRRKRCSKRARGFCSSATKASFRERPLKTPAESRNYAGAPERLFVVNDRADIAMLLGCRDCTWARTILRPPMRGESCRPAAIIGFSTHNEQQLRAGDSGAGRLSGDWPDLSPPDPSRIPIR